MFDWALDLNAGPGPFRPREGHRFAFPEIPAFAHVMIGNICTISAATYLKRIMCGGRLWRAQQQQQQQQQRGWGRSETSDS
jgi:hypothetical protein